MPKSAGRGELLTRRALGRATLERQLLLRRWDLPVTAAVERLAGLNAQDPEPHYIGLWARLGGFTHDALSGRLHDRGVMRSTLLRGTQHRPARSLHHGRGGRTRLPPRGPRVGPS